MAVWFYAAALFPGTVEGKEPEKSQSVLGLGCCLFVWKDAESLTSHLFLSLLFRLCQMSPAPQLFKTFHRLFVGPFEDAKLQKGTEAFEFSFLELGG